LTHPEHMQATSGHLKPFGRRQHLEPHGLSPVRLLRRRVSAE
jgi:hypothetical protein